MPPPIDPNAVDPRKRGLLGGLQSFGGLLGRGFQTLGRNFDRNAVGGIDQAMGADFTPDMRQGLRSNAIMALGQMLATQGKTGIQEGLQKGQERTLGAWKLGRERRQEEAGQNLLAGSGMDRPPAPGQRPMASTTGTPAEAPGAYLRQGYQPPPAQAPAPPTMIEKLQQRYEEAMFEANRLRGSSYKPVVEARNKWLEIAENAQKAIVELSKTTGAPIRGVDPTGKSTFATVNAAGQSNVLPGITPEAQTAFQNEGGTSALRNLQTGELIGKPNPITESANARAMREQQGKQFNLSHVLDAIRTNTGVENAATSRESNLAQQSIARERNAIGWGQLANARKNTEMEAQKGLPGDAGKTATNNVALADNLEILKGELVTRGKEAVDEIVSGRNRELYKIMKDASDLLGRSRSGGAIGIPEGQTFEDLIVGWRDSWNVGTPDFESSLNRLIVQARANHQAVDPSGRVLKVYNSEKARLAAEAEARRSGGSQKPPVKIPGVLSVEAIP